MIQLIRNTLVIRTSIKGQSIWQSIPGEKVNTQDWNARKQRHKYSTSLNKYLDYIEQEIQDIKRRLKMEGNYNVPTLKLELSKLFDTSYSSPTLVSWLEHMKERKENDPDTSDSYVRIYKMTIETVKGYEDTLLDNISVTWMEDFKSYIYSEGKSINTFKTIYRIIIAALHQAYKEDKMTKHPDKIKTRLPSYHIINPYNTSEELQGLKDKKVVGAFDIMKTLYLLGCETGQRPNRYTQLNNSYIQGDHLVLQQQKTDTIIKMPLTDELTELLDKATFIQHNNRGFFRGDVVNKLRKGLPQLWRSVGLTQDFIRREVVKGKKEDVKYAKCELIKPHTARRTFAMIKTYEENWPEWKVMRYTGHQSSNNLRTYLKCTA